MREGLLFKRRVDAGDVWSVFCLLVAEVHRPHRVRQERAPWYAFEFSRNAYAHNSAS